MRRVKPTHFSMAVSSIEMHLVIGGLNKFTSLKLSSIMVFISNSFVGRKISAKVNSILISGRNALPTGSE
jgi:hypothetical protein